MKNIQHLALILLVLGMTGLFHTQAHAAALCGSGSSRRMSDANTNVKTDPNRRRWGLFLDWGYPVLPADTTSEAHATGIAECQTGTVEQRWWVESNPIRADFHDHCTRRSWLHDSLCGAGVDRRQTDRRNHGGLCLVGIAGSGH